MIKKALKSTGATIASGIKLALKLAVALTVLVVGANLAVKAYDSYSYRDLLEKGDCFRRGDIEKFQVVLAPIYKIEEVGDRNYLVKINAPMPLFPGDPVTEDTPREWFFKDALNKAKVNATAEVVKCPAE